MALPFDESTFDAAVMPLVIFFVPDPAKGVAEMARVVRRGGIAAAYGWDLEGGGFPYAALQEEMRAMALPVPMPPSPDASRIEVLRDLWNGAGLQWMLAGTRGLHGPVDEAEFTAQWRDPIVGPELAALAFEQPEAAETAEEASAAEVAGSENWSARYTTGQLIDALQKRGLKSFSF